MFERFTERARRVIFFARYEACQCGSAAIGPEHLLLGLLREDSALIHHLPETNAASLRQTIDEHLTREAPIPTATDLPLSESARQILKYAADEADGLATKHIGTEHLLLGLLEQ